MPLTFDHADKAFLKKEHHLLELDPLPPLVVGSKPADKHDGENSVHTPSPAPSDTRSTPTTGFKQSQAKQVGESHSSVRISYLVSIMLIYGLNEVEPAADFYM
jgi:hypothetical protein